MNKKHNDFNDTNIKRRTENTIIVMTIIFYFLLLGSAVFMTIHAIKSPTKDIVITK